MESEEKKEKHKTDVHKTEHHKPEEIVHESHEKIHEKTKSHNKITLTEKFRENPWILSTLVLGIIILVLLVGNFGGGKVISEKDASDNVIGFLNKQTGGGVAYVSSKDLGGLYEITVSYNGQNIPIYSTKDGDYLAQGVVPFSLTDDQTNTNQNSNQNQQIEEIPKSDKPKVELFVMSYCPYGTQAEKGILPAVALLGDKIDFKLRAVHYVLHGDKEDLENKRQLCIREEQGQNKLNKYLVCILNSTDVQAPANVTACEKTAGIDSAKLQTCLSTKADDYFASDSALSQGYGVRGSPTLIINGVQSNAGGSPSSYLQGICNAFNTAPSECDEQLSSSNPSAGFGYKEGSDTVANCVV